MTKNLLIFVTLLIASSAFTFEGASTPKILVGQEVQAIPWPFTSCGDGDWKIQSLTLDQTPKRNINDNIVTTGTAKKSITFKRVDINVKLNGAFLDKQTEPFAKSYESGDAIEFSYKNFIPSFAPAGTYTLAFQFIDSLDKNNGCLQFQFKL